MLSGTNGGGLEGGPHGNRTPGPNTFVPTVVLCKGIFDDTTDPGLMDKVCHYMTIARVPDCRTRESRCLLFGVSRPTDLRYCTVPG